MLVDFSARVYGVVARLIPASIAGYVLPGLRRQIRVVGATAVEDAPTRLLIGPANSAGQGYAWARAAELLPDVTAVNVTFRGDDDVFAFTADHVVPASALVGNHRWRQLQRKALHTRFTHVIVESGAHLYEPQGPVLRLVEELQQAGVRPALLWHGSDIRVPSRHAAHESESPFRHDAYPDTAVLEAITHKNHALVAQAGVPVFVSTPDLLLDLPDATWLPVVVDPERWTQPAPRRSRAGRRPLVVHAPSRAGLKGSAMIADTVARLHDEGVIDYREVRGIPSADIPALYGSADIVLDQFSLGIYGVSACEAMAAGCVVVSHVSDQVRATVRERTGLELPIVEARAQELERVLRALASDPGRCEQRMAEGSRFVRAVHDGTRSASVLMAFLSS